MKLSILIVLISFSIDSGLCFGAEIVDSGSIFDRLNPIRNIVGPQAYDNARLNLFNLPSRMIQGVSNLALTPWRGNDFSSRGGRLPRLSNMFNGFPGMGGRGQGASSFSSNSYGPMAQVEFAQAPGSGSDSGLRRPNQGRQQNPSYYPSPYNSPYGSTSSGSSDSDYPMFGSSDDYPLPPFSGSSRPGTSRPSQPDPSRSSASSQTNAPSTTPRPSTTTRPSANISNSSTRPTASSNPLTLNRAPTPSTPSTPSRPPTTSASSTPSTPSSSSNISLDPALVQALRGYGFNLDSFNMNPSTRPPTPSSSSTSAQAQASASAGSNSASMSTSAGSPSGPNEIGSLLSSAASSAGTQGMRQAGNFLSNLFNFPLTG